MAGRENAGGRGRTSSVGREVPGRRGCTDPMGDAGLMARHADRWANTWVRPGRWVGWDRVAGKDLVRRASGADRWAGAGMGRRVDIRDRMSRGDFIGMVRRGANRWGRGVGDEVVREVVPKVDRISGHGADPTAAGRKMIPTWVLMEDNGAGGITSRGSRRAAG